MRRHIAAVLFLTALLRAWNANYSIGLDQYKNTSTLSNSLTFSRGLTETLSLNGSANFTALREYALNSFTDGRSGRGWLSWRPVPGLELSAEFARSLDLKDIEGKMEQDRVHDSGTGQIRYAPADWLSLNMRAGLFSSSTMERDSLEPKVNDGSLQDVGATLNRRLFGWLNTNLNVTRGRSFGSLVDSGRDNISARAAYNFPSPWLGGRLTAEVSAGRNYNTYYEDRTNRYGDTWGHTESVTLPELIPGIFMEMSGGWSYEDRTNRDFEPDSVLEGHPNDNTVHNRNIGSTIVWDMLEDVELNISVSRALSLYESKTYIAGVPELFDVSRATEDRTLSFRISYTPGGSSITFHRIVDLHRTDTEGTWEDSFGNVYQDDTDNDELREMLGVSARIPLNPWFTLKGEMQGQRRETMYIMAAMSGESRRSSTYSVRPGYECRLAGGWKLDHSVKLSADYTTYFFPEFTSQGNRLSRRLDSFFNFSRMSSDSTLLGLSHSFWFRDQGRYENRLYSRTSETVNSRVTLNTGFHVSARVGVTPSYGWEYSWNNRLDLGYSEDEHIHHLGLKSSIKAFGGVLSTGITRSFRRTGTPSYWQASVSFNCLL